MAWSYEEPHNYATAVKGLISFFNERVDVSVDGVSSCGRARGHTLAMTRRR